MIKNIGKSKLLLLFFIGCTRMGGGVKNYNKHFYNDVQFIHEDSLVANYCSENYGFHGYNCDSIISINTLSDNCSNDKFNLKRKSRCYTISFFLEEDYVHANMLLYEFNGDSVYFYKISRKDVAYCDFNLISARRLTASNDK